MGSRGPMPKEGAQRRNKEGKPHEVSADHAADIPELPETYKVEIVNSSGAGKDRVVWTDVVDQPFGDIAQEHWDRVWGSPLAAEFRPETQGALLRWIVYVDRFWCGDHSVEKAMLALEKEFALTWAMQKRERLKFEKPAGDMPAVKSKAERRKRVKVVAPEAAK